MTFGIGPAGTGKTYLAMALAVAALAEKQVGRIILTRPAVEAGERLGFLPGDMLAKVDPYLRPLFDALYDMLDADKLTAHMERGVIEVAPLAFMRGRTLNDSFIILDEAQNTSPEQMQMFLTRLGFGSKVVDHRRRDAGRPPARPGVGPDPGARHPRRDRRDRVRRVHPPGRRPAQARPADRRGVQATRRRDRHRAQAVNMVGVEVENRSGAEVEESAAVELAQRVLGAEGIEDGELGLAFVGAEEMRALKRDAPRDRRGDGRALVPARRAGARSPTGCPRALGDVVICPHVVGEAWRAPARARAAAPARLRPRRGDGGAGGVHA